MKTVKFLAQIDETKCKGCGICENVCPTEAIKLLEKKANVDSTKCLACSHCWDQCPEGAIKEIARPEPITFGIDPKEVDQLDQTRIRELCLKAHLHPNQWLCLCSMTRVREGAAAVLKGAKSPEEIALMTGARSGCLQYCLQTSLRLLKAHGVEITEPKGHRWYNTTQTLWDIPEEVIRKYPGHYFEEDKKIFRKF
jgi:ferredoxin